MTVKCPQCGKEADLIEDNWLCHNCRIFISKKMEIYSRTVGYLRPISQWNPGKQQEFKDRKTFKLEVE
jgi:ribonucleoside-triphosphate reductase